jgi:hypothetical protein
MARLKKGFGVADVDQLVEADWNYKRDMDDPDVQKLMKKLEANIKSNGQIENLIVRELDTGFYEVVNGNHRLLVMRALKKKQVQVFNLGKVSEAKAQRIAVETNETKFEADPLKLGRLLKDLSVDEEVTKLLVTMPYSSQQFDDLVKLSDFDWSTDSKYNENDTNKQGEKPKTVKVEMHEDLYPVFCNAMTRARNLMRDAGASVEDTEITRPLEVVLMSFANLTNKEVVDDLKGKGGRPKSKKNATPKGRAR